MDFAEPEALLERLTNPSREVVFLVGSPLTAPTRGSPLGVPDVKGMLALIRDLFLKDGSPRALEELTRKLDEKPLSPYQVAFQHLSHYCGTDVVNTLIQEAVLKARLPESRPAASQLTSIDHCEHLENELDSWHYTPAVDALGRIVAGFVPRIGRMLLTTNFDPLVELSIRRAGGRVYSRMLAGDGSLDDMRGEGSCVVHLHGYWYGTDTLHTPLSLGQDRPQLRASLQRLLRRCTVVVMAYSGWDDVFTRALVELGGDMGESPDVLWCWYERDPAIIQRNNAQLFDRLGPAIARHRVTFFPGVDCHVFLPRLLNELVHETSGARPYLLGLEPARDEEGFIHRTRIQDAVPRINDGEKPSSPSGPFQKEAKDLRVAQNTNEHRSWRQSLESARDTFQGVAAHVIGKMRPEELERRLMGTVRSLSTVVADESHFVKERARPQIPQVFMPGPPLCRRDAALFKGRSELIRLIDHDLADDRHAPLLITGQCRMGKTSLLHMLPERLGSRMYVVILNFQVLPGSRHREHPHRWIAETLATAKPGLPKLPERAAWGETLAWLREVEEAFGCERILVAIDELKFLPMGIEEGWISPAFLDFLHAVGKELRRIRLLLVSGRPSFYHGRSWAHRLIGVVSAVQRDISYLLPDEATELVRNPVPNFPDIYPSGGVERIVQETHGHPYLVQFVCDSLVRDLNSTGRMKADNSDLERAFDEVLNGSVLFQELWRERTDGEHSVLRQLARNGEMALEESATIRELVQQGYVEARDGGYNITVPLFQRWIRENGV